MTADDVTDAMAEAAWGAYVAERWASPRVRLIYAIAAAINASGCVLVPRNTLKILADTACAKGAMEHAEIMALGDVADLLSAPQPGKEKGDE